MKPTGIKQLQTLGEDHICWDVLHIMSHRYIFPTMPPIHSHAVAFHVLLRCIRIVSAVGWKYSLRIRKYGRSGMLIFNSTPSKIRVCNNMPFSCIYSYFYLNRWCGNASNETFHYQDNSNHLINALWNERFVLHWASYHIRKIAGCACAGNAGNVFPATDFKGNR